MTFCFQDGKNNNEVICQGMSVEKKKLIDVFAQEVDADTKSKPFSWTSCSCGVLHDCWIYESCLRKIHDTYVLL